MRRAILVAALGAVLGAAYGALIATTFPLLTVLTQPPSPDVLFAAAAMELYVAGYGFVLGAAIGLGYGIATAIVVAIARRAAPRSAGALAALAVLLLGIVVLPDHFGDAPLYSASDPQLDQLLQLLIFRAVPAAIAAVVAWRFARPSHGATSGIPAS